MPEPLAATSGDWRLGLPVLTTGSVTLREPAVDDPEALADLLLACDATHFGMEAISEAAVRTFVERAGRERAAGVSFTYVITQLPLRRVIGVIQVRRLDPAWETAEWECTLSPSSRGTGAFLDAARLAGSFAFDTIGLHRLECRVPIQNGRANGALRKLGGVEEGVLRRSLRRGGEYRDQVLWSIHRDDWGPHWVSTAGRLH